MFTIAGLPQEHCAPKILHNAFAYDVTSSINVTLDPLNLVPLTGNSDQWLLA